MASMSIFVVSDTHNEWPYSVKDPTPMVDVFIHCGDLTQYGGLPSFARAIDHIMTVDAELKLVVAGNHDVELDSVWQNGFAEDEDDLKIGAKCVSLMQSQQDFGIHYLEEGTHTFKLNDGRTFTVYATPYTPKYGDFAFLYGADEDRFSEGVHIMPEGVDIMISHGPPAFPSLSNYTLDLSKGFEHCGCEKLAKALQRVRPRLCCFGHIHEGRAAVKVDWESKTLGKASFKNSSVVVNWSVIEAETVLVNAAVFGEGKG